MFRVSRWLELIWAAVFTSLAAATIAWHAPGWPATVALTLLTTLAVIAAEMRKASYHGIAWRRINPELPKWWESQIAG